MKKTNITEKNKRNKKNISKRGILRIISNETISLQQNFIYLLFSSDVHMYM